MGVMLSRDEIMEFVGADTWEDVEVNFGGISHNWVLAECNRMWPGDDNDYLALSISEQLDRNFADAAADMVNALADDLFPHKRLYDAVIALVTTDPFPYNETSLEDWLIEGDTDGMTPAEIAAEWDEVNSHNPRNAPTPRK